MSVSDNNRIVEKVRVYLWVNGKKGKTSNGQTWNSENPLNKKAYQCRVEWANKTCYRNKTGWCIYPSVYSAGMSHR